MGKGGGEGAPWSWCWGSQGGTGWASCKPKGLCSRNRAASVLVLLFSF